MLADMKLRLRSLLLQHEGYKMRPYTDTKGNITIGIGRNLTERGVMPTEIDQFFNNDADYFFHQLSITYHWYPYLDTPRQIALIDLSFAGMKTFAGFRNMIAALEDKNYAQAANEILNSRYAKEVGRRATDLADIIRTGVLP